MPGQNLVLTIDANIQFMAERALDHAMEQTQARQRHGGGAGRAYRADSGAGHSPTFNPNTCAQTTPGC